MTQTLPKKVLLLGSGGLKISQAGEFDYSGSQAIKALKEEKIVVILINPNIATVQTDADMADRVYFQPLTVDAVSRIIDIEKPDAILLGFGGQTALNLGLALQDAGILKKYQVAVLGTAIEAIRLCEDRGLFKRELEAIALKTPSSEVVSSLDEAKMAAKKFGFPLMIRSGFSLGGLGSGIIRSEAMLVEKVNTSLSVAPHVLIEESLIGWSEFEYEIVRDKSGNALTVCNMENVDPMGIHTGESIVVSPSQSLDNTEYHFLREIAIKVANHFQIVGECNIQYAYHLKTRDYRIIEMNPRLSRSSALASKATGYPLAFVAAKLALGYRLFELKNTVTRRTCAFFEPALDYVVVKMPRWDIQKLKGAERRLGTEMKSVGEVMGIGRSFPEALQKAIRMLNIGSSGISDYPDALDCVRADIEVATDRRIFALYQFFLEGGSVQEAHALSQIDAWFLDQIATMAAFAKDFTSKEIDQAQLKAAKKLGFSDKAIAKFLRRDEAMIRALRLKWQVTPFVKQIDTLAGEFDAKTNYLYLTYHGDSHDVTASQTKATVIIGSGPHSIGSSVEFDWCAVTTSRTLKKLGETPIIINSNPETVSTDYDESDRLYFEELSFERLADILDFENLRGVIVSVGGQIANNLALPLSAAGYPILGTSAASIALAENRQTFSSLLNTLKVDQPEWQHVVTINDAKDFANRVGYPVLIRPSFVLSGAAMNVVYCENELQKYLDEAIHVSKDEPVVMSRFIEDAKELEIDGVAQDGQIEIYAISEHVENAGVHSGDATLVLPPQRVYLETIRRSKKITKEIVQSLHVNGPFNIQFIAKDNDLKVIECNLRASRSFPFVSKVTAYNFIEIATKILLGRYTHQVYNTIDLDYVGVKAPQFSYSRLKGANPVAHVEMASTGEVACLGEDLFDAFYRAFMASDQVVKGKRLFVSMSDEKKPRLLEDLAAISQAGFQIYATIGTYDYLRQHAIPCEAIYKVSEGQSPNVQELLQRHAVDLIINIPQSNGSSTQITDGFLIRRLAIDHHVPLITNLQIAHLALKSLVKFHGKTLDMKAWDEFVETP